MSAPFAYLFERFPSFTQTFCAREVAEMFRQEMRPEIFSIRAGEDQTDFPASLQSRVTYFPPTEQITAEMKSRRERGELPRRVLRVLKDWGEAGDKTRVYEALWLGPVLKERGIRHLHAHFAGMAARTAYWVKQFFGIPFSFTGHANDIFCPADFPVTVAELVSEARMVITETDFSRDWLQRKFPADAGKIHRTYNGIQTTGFPEARPEKSPPLILSVGRFVEKKGFPDLIDACGILAGRGVPFECRLIGHGLLEAELRARISERGLEDRVVLPGPLPQPGVRRMLAEARLFALACTRELDGGMDNLPTVIMEAMACGLPVVSTPVAGVPEMVREGETGFLGRENDPASLAAAMERLLRDPALAATLGASGRARVTEVFSVENTTRSLKHLLVENAAVIPPVEALALDPTLRPPSRWKWRLPI